MSRNALSSVSDGTTNEKARFCIHDQSTSMLAATACTITSSAHNHRQKKVILHLQAQSIAKTAEEAPCARFEQSRDNPHINNSDRDAVLSWHGQWLAVNVTALPGCRVRQGLFCWRVCPVTKAFCAGFWQGFPRHMYAKVLQRSSKCRGSPASAFGRVASSAGAREAPTGESYPAWLP